MTLIKSTVMELYHCSKAASKQNGRPCALRVQNRLQAARPGLFYINIDYQNEYGDIAL